MISYDGRRFRPEGATDPVVTYRQEGDLLWAEIPPGSGVRRGSLAGRCAPDGVLDFAYCMVLDDGEVVSGRCHSTPLRAAGRRHPHPRGMGALRPGWGHWRLVPRGG